MKRQSAIAALLYGTWDRPRPRRSHALHRRYDAAKLTNPVLELISQGYFKDPGDAQGWLDQHRARPVNDAREFLPKLNRPKTLRQRLKQFLRYLLGESADDGVRAEKAAEARSGRPRVKYRTQIIHPDSARSKTHPQVPVRGTDRSRSTTHNPVYRVRSHGDRSALK